MKNPVVICFNIQRRYFEQFGLTHFNPLKELLKSNHIELLPIINDGKNSI